MPCRDKVTPARLAGYALIFQDFCSPTRSAYAHTGVTEVVAGFGGRLMYPTSLLPQITTGISSGTPVHLVLVPELLDTSRRVDQLLLTGEEGMALGADLDADLCPCGTSMDHLATGASDRTFEWCPKSELLQGIDILKICLAMQN